MGSLISMRHAADDAGCSTRDTSSKQEAHARSTGIRNRCISGICVKARRSTDRSGTRSIVHLREWVYNKFIIEPKYMKWPCSAESVAI